MGPVVVADGSGCGTVVASAGDGGSSAVGGAVTGAGRAGNGSGTGAMRRAGTGTLMGWREGLWAGGTGPGLVGTTVGTITGGVDGAGRFGCALSAAGLGEFAV
ncbi:hypothetical protein [Arthrobacter sp. GAS37]|uniref:hypothetical protein n=1 Tax=Arthrobacter sp. GAS37 TaxID=3156261 RepID=UPI00385043B4